MPYTLKLKREEMQKNQNLLSLKVKTFYIYIYILNSVNEAKFSVEHKRSVRGSQVSFHLFSEQYFSHYLRQKY